MAFSSSNMWVDLFCIITDHIGCKYQFRFGTNKAIIGRFHRMTILVVYETRYIL